MALAALGSAAMAPLGKWRWQPLQIPRQGPRDRLGACTPLAGRHWAVTPLDTGSPHPARPPLAGAQEPTGRSRKQHRSCHPAVSRCCHVTFKMYLGLDCFMHCHDCGSGQATISTWVTANLLTSLPRSTRAPSIYSDSKSVHGTPLLKLIRVKAQVLTKAHSSCESNLVVQVVWKFLLKCSLFHTSKTKEKPVYRKS